MGRLLHRCAGLAALLGGAFLTLNWLYGYVVAFQSETNACFFMFGRLFLAEFLDHPAGLLRYAGRFLGQLYYYTWLGALLVSACIACFGVLFGRVVTKLRASVRVWQVVLPCLLLVALHTSTVVVIHDTLGLVAACGALVGYLALPGRGSRRAVALVATPVLYALLGAYVWLFVAWVAVAEWLDRGSRWRVAFTLGYVAFSIAVPLVAWRWVFPIPLRSALVCPILFVPPFRRGLLYGTSAYLAVDGVLAALLAVLLVLIPFWGRSSSGTPPVVRARAGRDRWKRVVPAVALAGVAVVLHVIRHDASLDTRVACRQSYRHQHWDALLEQAKTNPAGDIHVQFMTNVALYHKRRLLDDMFHYPQMWGTRGLVLNLSGGGVSDPADDDTDRAMYNSDLFYELGHVNAAFRHAYNAMSVVGETYGILERMAQCSMANGNHDMAAKYLSLLERTLFHADVAHHYRATIADPEAENREFGHVRSRLPAAGGRLFGHPTAPLLGALQATPDNRLAFDYLTAWFLLDKSSTSLGAIVKNIPYFSRAGYASLPTHCQEALLMLERQQGTPIDLQGFHYDEATRARVATFFEDRSRYSGRQDLPQRMQVLHGDTYMFYCFFVVRPTDVSRLVPMHGGAGGARRQE